MFRYRIPLVSLSLLSALLLAFFLPTYASGQTQPPRQAADLDDTQALQSFFDGLASAQRAAYPVAGMTVAVVKDGEIVFAKGYGAADVEENVAVDANTTLFRVGSVSKLFVWTAMMQLVESGALNLDADVNEYLDFEIPPAFGQPITLRNLMTHTPGFEDQGLGLFVSSAEQMAPLDQYLAQNIPARVFPPGEISAYSNYGASLAAYIVQRVSGTPFDAYVEQHIFAPLGMERSTFRQPLPPALADDVSKGYLYRQGRFQQGIFEFIPPYPAGALSTTATDMGRFMIAHLQHGQFDNVRILEEVTARQMHTLAFGHDPRLPGWGAGFSVAEWNGQRLVGHGGDTTYFHSELALLPDQNVGFFVSTNTDRGVFARFHMMQAFLQRYFPGDMADPPSPPQDFLQRADLYTGAYFPARMNMTGIEKVLALMQAVQVTATSEGHLAVTGLLGSEPTYWVERASHFFAPVSKNLPANATLLFEPQQGNDEQIQRLFFEQSAYIKQPTYASPTLHMTLLGLAAIAFLATIIAVPAVALIHRRYRGTAPQQIAAHPPGARAARWLAWLFALASLVFLVGFVLTVSDLTNVIFGLPPFLEALLLVPWFSAAIFVAIAALAVLAWSRSYWAVWGRIGYTLFAIVSLAYLWSLWFWNLL